MSLFSLSRLSLAGWTLIQLAHLTSRQWLDKRHTVLASLFVHFEKKLWQFTFLTTLQKPRLQYELQSHFLHSHPSKLASVRCSKSISFPLVDRRPVTTKYLCTLLLSLDYQKRENSTPVNSHFSKHRLINGDLWKRQDNHLWSEHSTFSWLPSRCFRISFAISSVEILCLYC